MNRWPPKTLHSLISTAIYCANLLQIGGNSPGSVVSGVRCANSWGLGPFGPSLVRGGALLLFPGIGSPERSGRAAHVGSFHSPSHGQSPWGYFYSFCRGSRALPMLSLFPICRPCGERESFQTRILGSYQSISGQERVCWLSIILSDIVPGNLALPFVAVQCLGWRSRRCRV